MKNVVIIGDIVVEITKQQFDDVMTYMAERMADIVVENMVGQGKTRTRAEACLTAFWDMCRAIE